MYVSVGTSNGRLQGLSPNPAYIKNNTGNLQAGKTNVAVGSFEDGLVASLSRTLDSN
jgi:hypothetical protein